MARYIFKKNTLKNSAISKINILYIQNVIYFNKYYCFIMHFPDFHIFIILEIDICFFLSHQNTKNYGYSN